MSIDVIGQPAWPDVVLIRLGWFLGLQYYIQSAFSVKIFLSAEDNDHDQNEENDDGQRGNSKLCCQIFLLILQCFIQFWLTPTHPVESSFGQRLKFQTET